MYDNLIKRSWLTTTSFDLVRFYLFIIYFVEPDDLLVVKDSRWDSPSLSLWIDFKLDV